MSTEGWLSAQEARQQLSKISDTPEQTIIQCVIENKVRTRFRQMHHNGQPIVKPPQTLLNSSQFEESFLLKNAFWENVIDHGFEDWLLGSFGYTNSADSRYFEAGEKSVWRAFGVEFFWPDIEQYLRLTNQKINEISVQTTGKLPIGAKPNDLKHEEAAHTAAELVRTKKIKLSEAIRESVSKLPTDQMRKDTSQHSAIRRSYDKMYDRFGIPIKN